MERATLPASQKNPKTDKLYKLFRLENAAFAETEMEIVRKENGKAEYTKTENANTEFYYIGSEKRIGSLIDIYKGGYATDTWTEAKAMLLKLQQKGYAVPQIIIFDSQLGYQAISEFRSFLNSHQQLSLIPLVLDDRGLAQETKLRYRKERLVDEIINLDSYNRDSLLAKARFLNKIKSESVNRAWRQKIETHRAFSTKGSVIKRVFDIIISSLLLICFSPVLLLIAIAIKLESRGPVFYIAKRAGRGYRIFNFYKFRTMIVGADAKINDFSHLNQYNATSEGPKFFKIENDPRITKIGAFLRKTSLDELPQLVNVLLGDMSLVGNRPLPLYEAATLTTDEWAQRFMAPAGITGLWQIKKRGNKDMSVEERISLDIAYASKSNFAYDLWIMANTPTALIQKTNV
ncbi:MAG TPA: sugar transferase [Chitinophagaceae bacterium]|nr:sugar transferase [Chitinophagaceae bacterium]